MFGGIKTPVIQHDTEANASNSASTTVPTVNNRFQITKTSPLKSSLSLGEKFPKDSTSDTSSSSSMEPKKSLSAFHSSSSSSPSSSSVPVPQAASVPVPSRFGFTPTKTNHSPMTNKVDNGPPPTSRSSPNPPWGGSINNTTPMNNNDTVPARFGFGGRNVNAVSSSPNNNSNSPGNTTGNSNNNGTISPKKWGKTAVSSVPVTTMATNSSSGTSPNKAQVTTTGFDFGKSVSPVSVQSISQVLPVVKTTENEFRISSPSISSSSSTVVGTNTGSSTFTFQKRSPVTETSTSSSTSQPTSTFTSKNTGKFGGGTSGSVAATVATKPGFSFPKNNFANPSDNTDNSLNNNNQASNISNQSGALQKSNFGFKKFGGFDTRQVSPPQGNQGGFGGGFGGGGDGFGVRQVQPAQGNQGGFNFRKPNGIPQPPIVNRMQPNPQPKYNGGFKFNPSSVTFGPQPVVVNKFLVQNTNGTQFVDQNNNNNNYNNNNNNKFFFNTKNNPSSSSLGTSGSTTSNNTTGPLFDIAQMIEQDPQGKTTTMYMTNISGMTAYLDKSTDEIRWTNYVTKQRTDSYSGDIGNNNLNTMNTNEVSNETRIFLNFLGMNNKEATGQQNYPNNHTVATKFRGFGRRVTVDQPQVVPEIPPVDPDSNVMVLLRAVWNNYFDTVKILVNNLGLPVNISPPTDPNLDDSTSMVPVSTGASFSPYLVLAALQGHEEMVTFLLAEGASVTAKVPEKYLKLIPEYAPLRIPQKLVPNHAYVDSFTPLVAALFGRNVNIFRQLINAGATVDSLNIPSVPNPFVLACTLGAKQIALLLMDEYKFSINPTSISFVLTDNNNTEPINANTVQHKTYGSPPGTETDISLMCADSNIRLLLPSFLSTQFIPDYSNSPLWQVCLSNQQTLIGNRPKIVNYTGECVQANYAVSTVDHRSQRLELVKELLRKGARIDVHNRNGIPVPLLFACTTDTEIFKALIHHAVATNTNGTNHTPVLGKSFQGWTLLHTLSSISTVDLSLILFLLDNGARPQELDPQNNHFILRLWYSWLQKILVTTNSEFTITSDQIERFYTEWDLMQQILQRIGIENYPYLLNDMVNILCTPPFMVDNRMIVPEMHYLLCSLFRTPQLRTSALVQEWRHQYPTEEEIINRYQTFITYEENHPSVLTSRLPILPDSNCRLPVSNTPLLFYAVNHALLLDIFLSIEGTKTNVRHRYGRTLLISAILSGNIRHHHFLDAPVTANTSTGTSSSNETMDLPQYNDYNAVATVKRLLSIGVDVHECDNFMNSPLHYAAALGEVEIMELLLQRGANVRLRSVHNVGIFEALFTPEISSNNGFNVEGTGGPGRFGRFNATRRKERKHPLQNYLGLSAPVIATYFVSLYNEKTGLPKKAIPSFPFIPIRWNHQRFVRAIDLLTLNGLSLKDECSFSRNILPLCRLVSNALGLSPKIIMMLVEKGMLLHPQSSTGSNSSSSSSNNSSSSNSNATSTTTTNHPTDNGLSFLPGGRTILMMGNDLVPELTQLFVSKVSVEVINAQDDWGRTALYYACHSIDNETIRTLISAKADPRITDKDNISPLLMYLCKFEEGLRDGTLPNTPEEWDTDTQKPYYTAIKLLCPSRGSINATTMTPTDIYAQPMGLFVRNIEPVLPHIRSLLREHGIDIPTTVNRDNSTTTSSASTSNKESSTVNGRETNDSADKGGTAVVVGNQRGSGQKFSFRKNIGTVESGPDVGKDSVVTSPAFDVPLSSSSSSSSSGQPTPRFELRGNAGPATNSNSSTRTEQVARNPDGSITMEGTIDGVKISMDKFIHVRNLLGYYQKIDPQTSVSKHVSLAKETWNQHNDNVWKYLRETYPENLTHIDGYNNLAVDQVNAWKKAIEEENTGVRSTSSSKDGGDGYGSCNSSTSSNRPSVTFKHPVEQVEQTNVPSSVTENGVGNDNTTTSSTTTARFGGPLPPRGRIPNLTNDNGTPFIPKPLIDNPNIRDQHIAAAQSFYDTLHITKTPAEILTALQKRDNDWNTYWMSITAKYGINMVRSFIVHLQGIHIPNLEIQHRVVNDSSSGTTSSSRSSSTSGSNFQI